MVNYVECRGNKCRNEFPNCRERYCTSCFGDLCDLNTSQLIELCLTEVEYSSDIILDRNYGYHDDYTNYNSDSDSDHEEFINLLFNSSIYCYLSTLCLYNENIIKINYFTERT